MMTRLKSQAMLLSAVLSLTLGFSVALSINNNNNNSHRPLKRVIPITIFSGFLGSGKTTLLQHLLQNNQGCRIAVIVNDVASMNIDSKLVSLPQGGGTAAGIVQLQNGCACCSLSDELLASVSELVTLSDLRSYDENGNGEDASFDHIVIELSGVADPQSVRAKFQEAVLYDMPLMERVQLDTMVSLVDCSVFLNQLASSKVASLEETPELFYPDGVKPETMVEEDDDMPPGLLEALMAGERMYGSASGLEQDAAVVELLVSQCEIADVVLLNKRDLSTPRDMERIESIVRALNPRASVLHSEYGRLPLAQILAVAKGQGVAQAGLVDDHKDSVQAASRGDFHAHAEPLAQQHEHTSAKRIVAAEADHSHAHSHSHGAASHDTDSTDKSGDHSHGRQCDDVDCTDATHSHSHDHFAHGNIGTFVYRSRRPFHPVRLAGFLQHLSLTRGLPEDLLTDKAEPLQVSDSDKLLLKRILRSKGFVWCADSDEAAMFWSHAGISFELSCLGRWWATLDRAQWPVEAIPSILQDFDSGDHDESDGLFKTVGDRRQELVFIGHGLKSTTSQTLLAGLLDQCLLQEDEWSTYCTNRNDAPALRSAFVNPFQVRMVTY